MSPARSFRSCAPSAPASSWPISSTAGVAGQEFCSAYAASKFGAPLRFVAGADAVATIVKKARDLIAQADANLELSSNLARDDA